MSLSLFHHDFLSSVDIHAPHRGRRGPALQVVIEIVRRFGSGRSIDPLHSRGCADNVLRQIDDDIFIDGGPLPLAIGMYIGRSEEVFLSATHL